MIYNNEDDIESKIRKVCKEIYRAENVVFSKKASIKLKEIKELGYDNFPVCMAKTQYSFSDDPKAINAPVNFEITISDLRINSGAGFIVALTGDIMTMPGLPKVPQSEKIKIYSNGKIEGLF